MPSIVFISIILFISTSKAILNTTNDYVFTTEEGFEYFFVLFFLISQI